MRIVIDDAPEQPSGAFFLRLKRHVVKKNAKPSNNFKLCLVFKIIFIELSEIVS